MFRNYRLITLSTFLILSALTGSAQVNCAATWTDPTVRYLGLSEQMVGFRLTCQGGSPTAAGALVPQGNVTLTLSSPITSRLIAPNGMSEALLLIDDPQSSVRPVRPLLNCGSPAAPDDSPGNGGPTTTAPGVCAIRSTGDPDRTYDGTPGVPGQYATGRPNVFQGRVTGPNTITFANVPLDPPGVSIRTFRFANVRFYGISPVVPGVGSLPATATVALGNWPAPTGLPARIGWPLGGSVIFSVTVNNTVNNVRMREGYAGSYRARNFAAYYRNHALVPGNGGDFGVDRTTLYEQNVTDAFYFSEDGLVAAGRPTPPGGNPNGSPLPRTGSSVFQPGGNNVIASGQLAGPTTLNTQLAGLAATGSRVALAITGLPDYVGVEVPASIRLAPFNAPSSLSGIAQLVAGHDAHGAGGAASAERNTGVRVPLPVSGGSALAVYEILFNDQFSMEDLEVPIGITRTGPPSANPLVTPRVNAGLAPFYSEPNAATARTDAEFPTPRFGPLESQFGPFDQSARLNLGPLAFETSQLPNGALGVSYVTTVLMSGGTPPYRFRLGGNPIGLGIDANGVLSGVPEFGGTFTLSVSVSDSVGTSVSRNFSWVVPPPSPGSFSLVSPADSASVSLTPTLTWTESVGATSYEVWVGQSPQFTIRIATTTSTSYSVAAPLLPGTLYWWRVVARNLGGFNTTTTRRFVTSGICAVTASPVTRFQPATGGGSAVFVDGTGCISAPSSDSTSWLTVSNDVFGSDAFQYTAAPNPGVARLGKITLSPQNVSFKVMQGGAPAVQPFNDVPPADPYFDYVSLMSTNGITAGCSITPPLYCPATNVTRAQMAVFIVAALNKALGTPLNFPPTPYFNDVASTSGFFPFIQRIRELNITAGCSVNPPLYCPDATITQGQMAVFMIRAWMQANNLTTFTFPSTPYFTDVPPSHPFFSFIQKMRELGFWNGCSATEYCESAPVSRGQMAPMILRAILGAP